MQKLKFYLVLLLAKMIMLVMKVLGLNATNFPGEIALKLYPDFLKDINKPKKIVSVTGTNGKTTVSNIIVDILIDRKIKVLNNRLGSNIKSGIATSLISGVTLFNKSKYDIGVLETDERSAILIYEHIKPNYIVCTNLFRDSSKRNAHTDFIVNILNKAIPKTSKLVLNADDLISSNIGVGNEKVFFGINRLETDTLVSKNIVKDIVICPLCDNKLTYNYYRYHHIGSAFCSRCGFKNYEAKYLLNEIDTKNKKLLIKSADKEEYYYLISDNIINIYNELAALSVLKELGLSSMEINDSLKKIKIVESRYYQKRINNKDLIIHLAKGQNPIACSRAIDFIVNLKGTKTVILTLDDISDNKNSAESNTWFYETDFEFLQDDQVKQIIASGPRCYDLQVRLMMAGIDVNKIVCLENEFDIIDYIDYQNDLICVLYDLYLYNKIEKIKKRLIKRLSRYNV